MSNNSKSVNESTNNEEEVLSQSIDSWEESECSSRLGRMHKLDTSRNGSRRVAPRNEPTGSPPRRRVLGIDDQCGESGRSRVRSRGYCFTINNYLPEDEQRLRSLAGQGGPCTYVVWQREKAPETGTRHLQGYAYFVSPKDFGAVRKLFQRSNGAYHASIFVAKGSPEQNIRYCTKEDTRLDEPGSGPFELGRRPGGQGHRSDVDDAVETAKQSGSYKIFSFMHNY